LAPARRRRRPAGPSNPPGVFQLAPTWAPRPLDAQIRRVFFGGPKPSRTDNNGDKCNFARPCPGENILRLFQPNNIFLGFPPAMKLSRHHRGSPKSTRLFGGPNYGPRPQTGGGRSSFGICDAALRPRPDADCADVLNKGWRLRPTSPKPEFFSPTPQKPEPPVAALPVVQTSWAEQFWRIRPPLSGPKISHGVPPMPRARGPQPAPLVDCPAGTKYVSIRFSPGGNQGPPRSHFFTKQRPLGANSSDLDRPRGPSPVGFFSAVDPPKPDRQMA